jgi:hypothetical protein
MGLILRDDRWRMLDWLRERMSKLMLLQGG